MRALAAALAVVFATGCTGARRPSAAPDVRVLVYNIHAGKDAAGIDNLARVAALVRAARADIVLLQEVDRRTRRSGGVDQLSVLARTTGLAAAFGKTLDYDGGEYGIAILSRWPITAEAVTKLRVHPPQRRAGGVYEPRGAQRATIAAPTGTITVVNTHLDASPEDHYRRQELRTVLTVGRDASSLLVGGDFNATPESVVQIEARRGGLRDAWGECGSGDGLTYPANAPVKRIDYLYLTGPATCSVASVLESTASDHRPLLGVVRLR